MRVLIHTHADGQTDTVREIVIEMVGVEVNWKRRQRGGERERDPETDRQNYQGP